MAKQNIELRSAEVPLARHAVASYIRDMALELSRFASTNGLPGASLFLAMAAFDADEHAETRAEPDRAVRARAKASRTSVRRSSPA